jgi:hypothetical protein
MLAERLKRSAAEKTDRSRANAFANKPGEVEGSLPAEADAAVLEIAQEKLDHVGRSSCDLFPNAPYRFRLRQRGTDMVKNLLTLGRRRLGSLCRTTR